MSSNWTSLLTGPLFVFVFWNLTLLDLLSNFTNDRDTPWFVPLRPSTRILRSLAASLARAPAISLSLSLVPFFYFFASFILHHHRHIPTNVVTHSLQLFFLSRSLPSVPLTQLCTPSPLRLGSVPRYDRLHSLILLCHYVVLHPRPHMLSLLYLRV